MKRLRVMAFLAVSMVVLLVLNNTLSNKSTENLCIMPDDYKEKCDVLFVGSSVILDDIYPPLSLQ